MLRIGVMECFHETNTFAPGKTELQDFKNMDWGTGEAGLLKYRGTNTSLGGVIAAADAEGFELVPILYTRAIPSGIVTRSALEAITAELCGQLKRVADSLDGLVFVLHGAMVSEHVEDVEGELLKRVRDICGEKPLAVTLDLHSNTSDEMVRLSDIMVGFDTYPHVDMHYRAKEAGSLLVSMINGRIQPVHALVRPNILVAPPAMDTHLEPMQAIMDKAFALERDPEVLNIVVAGGFPYADVHCAGMSVTVTTNANESKARQIAQSLSTYIREKYIDYQYNLVSVEQALEQARQSDVSPSIFVESSDNVGGGAPADATHALRALIDAKQSGFLCYIQDAEAVQHAASMGIGGNFYMPVGGKADRNKEHISYHGDSVSISGKVRLLSDGQFVYRGAHLTGQRGQMGTVAVIELADCPGSVVVLTEKRVSIRDIDQVHSIGLHAEDFSMIVVKAAIAWKTAFGDMAGQVLELDTPGCCSTNLHRFQYHKLPAECSVIGHERERV